MILTKIPQEKLNTISFFKNSFFKCLLIDLATLGLGCCSWASLVAVSGDYSPAAARGLFTAVASLTVEHKLWGLWASVIVARFPTLLAKICPPKQKNPEEGSSEPFHNHLDKEDLTNIPSKFTKPPCIRISSNQFYTQHMLNQA